MIALNGASVAKLLMIAPKNHTSSQELAAIIQICITDHGDNFVFLIGSEDRVGKVLTSDADLDNTNRFNLLRRRV